MPISVKVQHLCSVTLLLFKWQDGEASTQRQTNSSRIWPECFVWIPASHKAEGKCLTLRCVHGDGQPQSVSSGILWAPKQWAVFPSTYRHFRSLQACCNMAWMTPISWYKLKCEIAHSSFRNGEVVLYTMLPFEGDSSLSLISYPILIKPKVSIFESNYIRHTWILFLINLSVWN